MHRSKDLVYYRLRSRDQKELNSSGSPPHPPHQICLQGKANSSLLKLSEEEKPVTQGVSKPTGAGILLYLLLPAGVRSHSFFATINTLGLFSSTSKTRKKNTGDSPQRIRYLNPILTTSRFQLCLGFFFFFSKNFWCSVVADYFQILVLPQWTFPPKSLSVVKTAVAKKECPPENQFPNCQNS